jgi:outer membrane protein TolC
LEHFTVGAPGRAPRGRHRPLHAGASRKLAAAFLAVGLLGSAAAQPAPPGPLTLELALRAAQDRSQALVAQDAAAAAARDMGVAAGQLPDPMLSVNVTNVPVNGPDRLSLTRDFMTMRSVGVMQTLSPRDKRQARAARFEREADVARETRALQLTELRRDTAQAWIERLYRQRMVELLQAQRDEARLQVEAANAAYRAGRGGQADVFMAHSAVAQVEDRLQQAEAAVANATADLTRWVGDLARQPLAGSPAITRLQLEDHALEGALESHPELAVMAAKEAVARAQAEMARQDKRPDWNVELMYSQRGPAYSNMVSLGVSVPLQWNQKNLQDREVAARLAMVEQMGAEREEMRRTHLAEVRRWQQSWRSNLQRLALYDASLTPLAAERTRAALAAYRGGTGPLGAVLEARRIEIDTRMERLGLEMDTAALWARLEYLLPPGHEHAATPAADRSREQ